MSRSSSGPRPAGIAIAQRRGLLVAQRLGDRQSREQLLVAREHGIDIGAHAAAFRVGVGLRQAARQVEREQPGLPVRLERDGVDDRPAVRPRRTSRADRCRRHRPFAPVEIGQHGTAPIAQPRRRDGAVEVDAKGHGVGEREFADEARRHVIGEPELAVWSAGTPHSGPATRGKSRNSITASGIPWANILSVATSGARQPPRTGGSEAGRASACSVPPRSTTAGIAAAAESSDWL